MTGSRARFTAAGGAALAPINNNTREELHYNPNELQFSSGHGRRWLVSTPAVRGRGKCGRPPCIPAALCSITASRAAASTACDTTTSQPSPPALERLPVAIKKGDQLLPYVWDGKRISAMDEKALQDDDVNKGRFRNWLLGLQRRVHEAFLPDPRDVTPDYWEWLRWRLSQRFFSSTMQNFSFSALLMATGLGAKKAFAASAAINWLLKDGVSRIVRMAVSTSFGQTFDADLKRMRFVTSLVFTACMAGEFATPFWPQHFVALASISSVGRAVGLSAFVATQPAFQAALAAGGNLADLTSKNQAQHMVMDMLALGVSAGLTWLCRAMPRGGLLLPAVMYPLCAAGDLTCIWHELKAVQLRTLNRERAEMVIERWVRRGTAPDAAEITAAESLVLPSDVWSGLLPLAIVPLERQAPSDPYRLQQLLSQYGSEQYVLSISRPAHGNTAAGGGGGRRGGSGVAGAEGGGMWGSRESLEEEEDGAAGGARWGAREQGVKAEEEEGSGRRLPVQPPLPQLPGVGKDRDQPKVLVSLSDRASPADIAKALLQAAYLRQAVLEHTQQHLQQQHHHDPHDHKETQAFAPHNNTDGRSCCNGNSSSSGSAADRLDHHGPHTANTQQQHHRHQSFSASSPSRAGGDAGSSSTTSSSSSSSSSHAAPHTVHQLLQLQQQQQHPHRHDPHDHHRQHHQGEQLTHCHDHDHWNGPHNILLHHSHSHTHSHTPHGAPDALSHNHQHPHPHHQHQHLPMAAHTASLSLSGSGHSRAHGHGQGHSHGRTHNHGHGSSGSSGSSSNGSSPSTRAGDTGGCEAATAGAGTGQGSGGGEQVPAGGAPAIPGCCGTVGERRSSVAQQQQQQQHRRAQVLDWRRIDDCKWAELEAEARRAAELNVGKLLADVAKAGWKLKPIMLNTTERVQFVRL